MDSIPAIESGDAAASQPASVPPAIAEAALAFDGDGAEYFRIWVIQTLLNVLTLGIYSPWAKVRKARWFAQHTMLLGDRFDYHGRPLPILVGRAVALALFVAWSYAFEFSLYAGLGVFAALCIFGPLLFASAQRFRLANTSWRGLRFDFSAPRSQLYAVCVPALAVWTVGTVLQAAGASLQAIVITSVVAMLCLPFAHARLKAMQHSHARFAGRRFTFEGGAGEFYKLYLKAFLVMAGAGIAAAAAGFVLARAAHAGGIGRQVQSFLVGGITVVTLWMFAWPYYAARMQAIVWPRTGWGDVRFRAEMKAQRLLAILVPGTLLTLLSVGLYWPFLAVAMARYRLETIGVVSPIPFEDLNLAAGHAATETAVGDAAADFFGLDLGW